MTDMDPPTVRVGQIWADNDPRVTGRTLRVHAIDGRTAICTTVTNDDETQALIDRGSPHARDRRGKTTRISIQRMKPARTGYRLIQDAPPE